MLNKNRAWNGQMSQPKDKKPQKETNTILKWCLTGLPLVGIVLVSFLPIQVWMQQALVLITLISSVTS